MPMNISALEAALLYLSNGWSIFPLEKKGRPLIRWEEFKDVAPSEELVREWWTKWPNAWIGLALGPVSNVVRIDADGGQEAITQLELLGGTPETMSFSSPSGGVGYLFQYFPHLKTQVVWKGSGVHQELRVQARGAYTVLPPSPGYEWLRTEPLARIPLWLQERVSGNMLEILERELYPQIVPMNRELPLQDVQNALDFISSDQRDTWLHVGMALHNMNAPFEVWDTWSRGSNKYIPGECLRLWNSFERKPEGLTGRTIAFLARQKGWTTANKYEMLTDIGSSKVLARYVSGKIKHSATVGWLSWDGRRWIAGPEAEKQLITEQKALYDYRCGEVVKSMNQSALALNRPTTASEVNNAKEQNNQLLREIDAKNKFLRALALHHNGKTMREVRLLTESDSLITCDYKTFDRYPMLLNCANGTLDLETLGLHDHNPSNMLMQVAPTPYDPSSKCPRWLQFVDEIFAGDKELSRWIQKLLGYCLTGLIDMHILPIMHGNGRNGKSTVVRALINTLGPDYAGTAPSHFLALTRGEQHPTKLVELYGKRILVDMETSDGMRLDEELVKRLTGGDQIKARRMYEDFWYFDPTHKLFLSTNYEPIVHGTDDAIWGRVLKVPFTQSFLGREEFGLDAKLASEAPGILAWLVEGCAMWRKEGLKDYPSSVRSATSEYRSEQNTVFRFFEERLKRENDAVVTKSAVISAYHMWCQANRSKQLSSKGFGVELKKWFGGDAEKLSGDRVNYRGIRLI